jgi:hypothetical protein
LEDIKSFSLEFAKEKHLSNTQKLILWSDPP